MTAVCLSVGAGPASHGPGERRAAHHVIGAAHHGAGHVGGSGPDHHAGAGVWSPGTAAGKGRDSVLRLRSVYK